MTLAENLDSLLVLKSKHPLIKLIKYGQPLVLNSFLISSVDYHLITWFFFFPFLLDFLFVQKTKPFIACLHDQNKSFVLEGYFYPANQSNLKSIQKDLIGWKKAGPPKKPLLFWSCKQNIKEPYLNIGIISIGKNCKKNFKFTHENHSPAATGEAK